jgi:hypothetical protein
MDQSAEVRLDQGDTTSGKAGEELGQGAVCHRLYSAYADSM